MSILNSVKNNLFGDILFNKVEELCRTDRTMLSIYKQGCSYIVKELEGEKDIISLSYDKEKNMFNIKVITDLDIGVIKQTVSITSDKIRIIKNLDNALNLNMIKWDWDWSSIE